MKVEISALEVIGQAEQMGYSIRINEDNGRKYVDYVSAFSKYPVRHETSFTPDWQDNEIRIELLKDFLKWSGLEIIARVQRK